LSYALEPRRPASLEATIFHGAKGQLYLIFEQSGGIMLKVSEDAGRSWGEPRALVDHAGERIRGNHVSLIRLKSGRLGLVYSTTSVPNGRSGRDGGTVFRVSDDETQSWSDPVVVERRFGICCSGHALVLSGGRIVVPVFKWINYDATGAAEASSAASVSFSYVYVSDDEGETWTQSLSELFVSHYRAAYDLEEPTVVELQDGRLMMHLRSQLGRIYRSYSEDQGISWSRPEPLPIAGGYTPSMVRRIPSTGHLLMIWNQVSRYEILTGGHRHRLSCAISKDDGETWENFKNLESLDGVTEIKPPPTDRIEVLDMWDSYGYFQPQNAERYFRAPGVLRICYPDVAFVGDEAIIVYDYGSGMFAEGVHSTKLRAIPLNWFTE
jgi:Neuraminidase (sialidase)